MAYYGYVVEIEKIRKHNNADRLQVVEVFGNSVVVGLNVSQGDKMIYFPTDGQLSYDYAWKNGLLREDLDGNKLGGYLDGKKRNIRTIRLRGECSDGILVPIGSLEGFVKSKTIKSLGKGDRINVIDGFELCKKYVPKIKKPTHNNANVRKQMSKKNEMVNKYPMFKEHVDTSQFAYNVPDFKVGDLVTMSLKLHGTSARTMYGIKSDKKTLIEKLLNRIGYGKVDNFDYISGTRKVIMEDYDGGFYGDNTFREKYHNFFNGKLRKGETIYYEIVGYVKKDIPIMAVADCGKVNDKEFSKRYGDHMTFSYGCKGGESDIYVYRMNITNDDGEVFEYPTWLAQIRCEQMGVKHVPVLEQFKVESEEQLLSLVKKYEDGADLIDPTHVREGVVLRIENREGFKAYKQKGFTFKVLESIIKDDSEYADMEEADGL